MLLNIHEYIRDEIPILHPKSTAYFDYWREEKRKCIEGMWAGGYYITPHEYFYPRHSMIWLQTDKRSKFKDKARPLLRDTDREIFGHFLVARGFSGFSEDTEISCDLRLRPDLLAKYPIIIDELPLEDLINITTPDGRLKRYEAPYDYMRKHFPKPMGIPLYDNPAKDFMIMGSRGGGKSYTIAGGIVPHEFLFNGAKAYNEQSIKNPSPVEIMIGSYHEGKSQSFLDKVKLALTELPGAYISGTTYIPSPFAKTQLKGSWDDEIQHVYDIKIGNTWKKDGGGTKAKIIHRKYSKNAEAGAGGRVTLSVIEEHGLVENLTAVYAANVDTMMNGTFKFGTQIYIGTSGNLRKVIEARKMFENPDDYDILAFQDEIGRKIGYFLPVTKTLNEFKDKNQNTDLKRAEEAEIRVRNEKKNSKTGDKTAYNKYIINRPLVWTEMFLDSRDNGLPVAEISARLEQLTDEYLANAEQRVELVFNPSAPFGVEIIPDVDKKFHPLNRFPLGKDEPKEGCVVIYERPISVRGAIPNDMYIVGHDTFVSDDPEKGGSLGTTYILRNPKYLLECPSNQRIVATYNGKPYTGREMYYFNQEKLLQLYGLGEGMLFYENNRGTYCKNYYDRKLKSHVLAHKPQIFSKKDERPNTPTTDRGYCMTEQLKRDCIRLLGEWFLEIVDYNEIEVDGEIQKIPIRNIDTVSDRAFLQECIAFNYDSGNFDRIMGFLGCIIGFHTWKTNEDKMNASKSKQNPLSALLNNPTYFDVRKLARLKAQMQMKNNEHFV